MSKTYRSTLKNISIIGFSQIIIVLITVIKGKFIAELLGPIGMGVNSLLSTPLNLIRVISGMGLDLSTIRNISEAYEENNTDKISEIVTIIRRLFLLAGIVGGSLTLILAPLLSQWTFGNEDYTWAFVWLSVTVFFASLNSAQSVLLRGMRKIDYLVKSWILGAIIGLITSVPLYYIYGIDGIVPSMIIASIGTLSVSWFYARKLNIKTVKLSYVTMYNQSTDMVKMGFILVIAIFIGSLTKFSINISISNLGSIADLGLYVAAISISTQFVSFILAALSADYFPRLAAVNKDTNKTNEVVNQQIGIVVLLAAPLLIIMMITSSLLIQILLSVEFLVITDFIRYVAIGSFFQVVSFSLGYISFSKNDKRSYLILEGGVSNLLNFSFSVIGYYFWGLMGLGISFMAVYGTYFIIIFIFVYKRYEYRITKQNIIIITSMLLLLIGTLFVSLFLNTLYAYIIGCLLLIISIYYSYYEFSKFIDIKSVLSRLISKIVKKKDHND